MTDDNIVLTVFIILPIASAVCLYVCFRRLRIHQRARVRTAALIAGNGLVFLFLCSVVLLGGEFYYRFIYDTTDSFGLTKTTAKWIARHYVLNNYDLRDSRDYRTRLREGTRRVTFLGDSFTAGHGVANVEDRFANRYRAARPNVDVQVVAINGYDTDYEIKLLRALKRSHNKFDLVVLVYCLNDISDVSPQWQRINRQIHRDPGHGLSGYLIQHSYFLNTLYYRWIAGHDANVTDYYHFVLDDYRGPAWEQQKKQLTTLRDIVTGGGGRLVVVTFPFLHSLGPDYAFAPVHKQLDGFWKSIHVPHLDLLDVYRSHKPSELVVNRFDAHPNEFAHKLAAEAIIPFLDKQLKKSTPSATERQ